MNPKLAIIVPCYNEEAVLEKSNTELLNMLESLAACGLISADSYILYVDDGSNDNTWEIICHESMVNSNIRGMRLSCNTGHQNALWAGLEEAVNDCDLSVSIDADLQDDINAIHEMMLKYHSGKEIVFGVRRNRDNDSWFKRNTANGYYRLMNMIDIHCIYNHADFRLMSVRAMKALTSFPERNIFLRGMVTQLGFPSDTVYYDRKPRMAGVSKYPLGKMLQFAANGITSFSIKPVRLIFAVGLIFTMIAMVSFIYVMIRYFQGEVIRGWTSLIVSVWLSTGMILLSMGIIGEYVGKIYSEVKRRPRYFVEKRTDMILKDASTEHSRDLSKEDRQRVRQEM